MYWYKYFRRKGLENQINTLIKNGETSLNKTMDNGNKTLENTNKSSDKKKSVEKSKEVCPNCQEN